MNLFTFFLNYTQKADFAISAINRSYSLNCCSAAPFGTLSGAVASTPAPTSSSGGGGGGGGKTAQFPGTPASGGSGIVIIRYRIL